MFPPTTRAGVKWPKACPEQTPAQVEKIVKAYEILISRHDIVIVEGVGGFLVPLFGDYFVADLAKEWGLPILVVAEAKLGTINHTLLTLANARGRGIPVMGIVMNHTSSQQGLAESLNASALRRWAEAPFLGSVPFLPGFDIEAVKTAIEMNLNLGPIEDFLSDV